MERQRGDCPVAKTQPLGSISVTKGNSELYLARLAGGCFSSLSDADGWLGVGWNWGRRDTSSWRHNIERGEAVRPVD